MNSTPSAIIFAGVSCKMHLFPDITGVDNYSKAHQRRSNSGSVGIPYLSLQLRRLARQSKNIFCYGRILANYEFHTIHLCNPFVPTLCLHRDRQISPSLHSQLAMCIVQCQDMAIGQSMLILKRSLHMQEIKLHTPVNHVEVSAPLSSRK